MKRIAVTLLVASCCVAFANISFARELLFQADPLDYAHAKRLGQLYRKEFQPRMFPHANWHQRLSYFSSDPDVDETLEVYSKPDASRWLMHRRAAPAITTILLTRLATGPKFDLQKELAAVKITTHEIPLPEELRIELELLWKTMLPGVAEPPAPLILTTHIPVFDAWIRNGRSIEAGRVARGSYDTPIYRKFVDVIVDLRTICDRNAKPDDPLLTRLPTKMRILRSRL